MKDIPRLIDAFETTPWAIEEEKYELIRSVLHDKERYVQLAEKACDTKIEEPQVTMPYVSTYGPVSVMQLNGVMSKRMNLIMALSGGTSTQIFGQSFDKLMADDNVEEIVISINSPGGAVVGTPELADKIFAGRKKKKITAVADSLAASAAYWVGSQASRFLVTKSGVVGSIGVYQEHVNAKKYYEERGLKIEFLRVPAGKAKPNDVEPIDQETRDHIMGQLTTIHDDFVKAVARGRGVKEDKVRESFGGGRTVMSQAALKAGMVDAIGEVEEEVASIREKQRMAKEEAATVEELKAQLAAEKTRADQAEAAKVTAEAAAETAKAESTASKAALAKQQDEAAYQKCLTEVKGYKNLNLGEKQAKILHALDKSDPEQAATLRQTFKDSDARVGANLTPSGTTATPEQPRPQQSADAPRGQYAISPAGQDLDKQVADLIKNGSYKRGQEAAAALFILENNPELAEQVAAGVNPDLNGDIDEEL